MILERKQNNDHLLLSATSPHFLLSLHFFLWTNLGLQSYYRLEVEGYSMIDRDDNVIFVFVFFKTCCIYYLYEYMLQAIYQQHACVLSNEGIVDAFQVYKRGRDPVEIQRAAKAAKDIADAEKLIRKEAEKKAKAVSAKDEKYRIKFLAGDELLQHQAAVAQEKAVKKAHKQDL